MIKISILLSEVESIIYFLVGSKMPNENTVDAT
jgi:hypothetical protein